MRDKAAIVHGKAFSDPLSGAEKARALLHDEPRSDFAAESAQKPRRPLGRYSVKRPLERRPDKQADRTTVRGLQRPGRQQVVYHAVGPDEKSIAAGSLF
jgi:hypothetical protein